MKQTIYYVIRRMWDEDSVESAYIVSTHLLLQDAEVYAKVLYKNLSGLDTCTFAEWSEFGRVRGFVRDNKGRASSIYVKSVDAEL